MSILSVVLSSASEPETIKRVYDFGESAFPEKPSDYDSLVEMTEELDTVG